VAVVSVLLATGLGLLVRHTGPFARLEWTYVDARSRLFLGSPDERIVLAEIQDGDVEAAQQALAVSWPWPLDVNAGAFQLLAAAGVKAVVVDVLHLDRGAGPDDHVMGDEELSVALASKLTYEAEASSAYGEAMRTVGAVALAFELAQDSGHDVPARRVAAADRLGSDAAMHGPDGLVRPEANLPVRRVIEGARLLGFANAVQDADGLVRRAAAVGRWGRARVLSLGYAGALLAEDAEPAMDERGILVGDTVQALMADGAFYVNFRGEPGQSYARVSPAQILTWAQQVVVDGEPVPEAAKQALAGKIVVWGLNLTGQRDIVPSPTSGRMPAPEFQATVLDNLLHGDGRVAAAWEWNGLLLLVLMGLVSVVGALVRSMWLLAAGVLVVVVVLGVTTLLAFRQGVVLDGPTPMLLLIGCGAFCQGRRLKQRRAAQAAAAARGLESFTGEIAGHTLLNVYRVERRLGAGGMATVHLAVDTNLGRWVVVKVPHLYLLAQPGATERFKREVEALIRFNHPSILRILAQGSEGEVPFVVLEYASGGSLGDVLAAREGKPMPFGEVLPWLRPLASALDYVHERGVVHRDVKPDNVLLDDHGNALLSDFGLVKALGATTTNLTQTGSEVGSPTYMAPEQAEADAVSPATDQYALATLAYEALTGRCPFPGDRAIEVLLKKLRDDPPSMGEGIGPTVEAVVLRGMARAPADRYPSCTAFVDALEAAKRADETSGDA
jgi:CHASE2 domain-containing sensor protein